MSKSIVISQNGGPEVMQWQDVDVDAPGAGEIRVRHTYVGLNFIDVYHRTGLYPTSLPSGLGLEAAGVVEALGEGVTDLDVGDRVAYASTPIGAYAEVRLMPASRVVRVSENVDDQIAAAMMLKGMTAEYLLCRTYPVQSGDWVLFHAAAGGVGSIATQWAKAIGANVIGTVGSAEKAELAGSQGCDHVINYNEENFAERVREITNGQGVHVVYDSVGKSTFEGSIDCLRPRGMMVSFGNASGPVAPFEPGMLAAKGSLYFTRPSLMTYTASDEDMQLSANAIMDMVGNGTVMVPVGQTYAFADVVQAHQDLEDRKTHGSTIFAID